MTSPLLLGPVLRHVDETSAAIWVETARAGTVVVRLDADGREWSAPTFAVHEHHFALVEVTGLAPGTHSAYEVVFDGTPVWPAPHAPTPPSSLRTLDRGRESRIAFGSCRTSVPHDAEHHRTHGVDALRTFGMDAAGHKVRDGLAHLPDLVLLLGDQVYADETSDEMREFIESRRSLDEPPGPELRDFEEYAHLYLIAWSDPWLRWLLSCLPSLMIFDDHDVRDDWNTSAQWRVDMEATSWWHGRIVAALASYWVYQHLGNLSVDERAQDEIWRELQRRQAGASGEVDLTEVLDAFAERVDQEPDTYRWSYARDLGDARLVVIDSRAARVLEPGHRSMLDGPEMDWLDQQLQGDCRHLFIGTSLPFLLPPGLHHVEAWSEAMVDGAWGRAVARLGERLRVEVDLEHWGAFNESFRQVCRMVAEVVRGERGTPPASIVFLSGDVHHSYMSEVEDPWRSEAGSDVGRPEQERTGTRVLQFVCSPIRNPLPRAMRTVLALLTHGVASPVGALAARSARVPDAPWSWSNLAGPWYDNNLAVLQLSDDQMEVSWSTGEVHDGRHDQPRLEQVARIDLDVPPPVQEHQIARTELRRRHRLRGRFSDRRGGRRVRGTGAD
ncbi:alkaline phosphatase D family protein [Ornithinimicrobium faecis]|uniref:alkaline phosphatase D family protein n=1 Tax=Ornithinimicrobium faecis TaxID=2934158 RepID=UPI002117C0A4|nr:alkaline phosphatase D family protein [Ornithinimicrobium sp. HY1745]